MSTPSHNANNSSETHTDNRQTRDPNQRETDISSQPHLTKIEGRGASLARFELNKPLPSECCFCLCCCSVLYLAAYCL